MGPGLETHMILPGGGSGSGAGDATDPCSSEGASSCLGCSGALRYLVGFGGAGFFGEVFWASSCVHIIN